MAGALVVLAVLAALFGGERFGALVAHDLDGRTYTVTAVRLDGVPAAAELPPIRVSFRDGWMVADGGCGAVRVPYRVVWTTLEVTGPPAADVPGCAATEGPAAAVSRFLRDRPAVHLDDGQRVEMAGRTGSLDLLERA